MWCWCQESYSSSSFWWPQTERFILSYLSVTNDVAFAFVEFETFDAAKAAIERMKLHQIHGQTVIVELVDDRGAR